MLSRKLLEEQLEGLKKQFEQTRFNLEALGGAIQFAQHLLNLPDQPSADEFPPPVAPAIPAKPLG